jgi:hypothetical protein
VVALIRVWQMGESKRNPQESGAHLDDYSYSVHDWKTSTSHSGWGCRSPVEHSTMAGLLERHDCDSIPTLQHRWGNRANGDQVSPLAILLNQERPITFRACATAASLKISRLVEW